ncbi:MAG: photosystem II protein PsbQ [Phormidesmis sp.]
MRHYRAVVGVLLAAIATFLVSCSGGPAAVAPTYTPEKISQLQTYVARIEQTRDRLPELERYIEKDNWVNVDNFTHGPLGQLRSEMVRLSNQLLPDDQKKAKILAEELSDHLQKIDAASQERNYNNAIFQYREFVADFDALLGVVPEETRKQAEAIEEDLPSTYEMVTSFPEEEETRAEPESVVRDAVLMDGGSEKLQKKADKIKSAPAKLKESNNAGSAVDSLQKAEGSKE